MRPKKIVVVWSACAIYAEDLSYVLRLGTRYAPFSCSADLEVDELLANLRPEVGILINSRGDRFDQVAKKIKHRQPSCRILVIRRDRDMTIDSPYVDCSVLETAGRVVLFEVLRTVSARKRGPRKGSRAATREALEAIERLAEADHLGANPGRNS